MFNLGLSFYAPQLFKQTIFEVLVLPSPPPWHPPLFQGKIALKSQKIKQFNTTMQDSLKC